MKKYLKKFRNIKGFTLIELLVVIGILGILAAALIATIDPFEQLKKGRDTTTRNTALEYLNALTRYYATHGTFPWGITTPPANCSAPTSAVALNASSMTGCTGALEEEGELKTGFGAAITNSGAATDIRIYTSSGTSSSFNLCFSPTSKSLKADTASSYSGACTGAAQSGCPSATAADDVCWQLFR